MAFNFVSKLQANLNSRHFKRPNRHRPQTSNTAVSNTCSSVQRKKESLSHNAGFSLSSFWVSAARGVVRQHTAAPALHHLWARHGLRRSPPAPTTPTPPTHPCAAHEPRLGRGLQPGPPPVRPGSTGQGSSARAAAARPAAPAALPPAQSCCSCTLARALGAAAATVPRRNRPGQRRGWPLAQARALASKRPRPVRRVRPR
jgi:hypothetical protein